MEKKSKAISYYICFLVMMVLIFGAHWIPPFGEVTEYGATVLGIFAGVVFGFVTIGLTIPSFLAMISLGFTQYGNVAVVLKDALGHNTILFTIGVMILSAALEQTGVTTKIVNMTTRSKFVKGKPWRLSFMILCAAYILAMFLNITVPTLVLWAFINKLCKQVGFSFYDKWPAVMYFGVVYMATNASFVLPFQVGVIANFGMLSAASNGSISYNVARYIVWALICSILLAIAYWLFARYIVRPDVTRLRNYEDSEINVEDKKFTKEQKYAVIIFALLIILLIGSSLVPAISFLGVMVNQLQTGGLTLIMVVGALCLRVNGKPLFDFGRLFAQGVVWDIVLMLASIFLMVNVLTDDATGIAVSMQAVCEPIMDRISPLFFLLVVLLLMAVLSNLTMNAAICCTMIPIVYILTQDNGSFDMVMFVAVVNFIGGMALFLPSASGGAAMIYSQTQWISKKKIMLYSIFTIAVTYIVMIFIGIPLGSVIL